MMSITPRLLTIFLVASMFKQGTATPLQRQPTAYWTNWYNRDRPSGTGDWETLSWAKQLYSDLCVSPVEIQCRVVGSKKPWTEAGQKLKIPCTLKGGLVCVNKQQAAGQPCLDYEVRYKCSTAVRQRPTTPYWTNWYSHDRPSGTGDWEVFSVAKKLYWDLCDSPVEVQCRTVGSKKSWRDAGQKLRTACTPKGGLVCVNKDQTAGQPCHNYEVRYKCGPGYACGASSPCTEQNRKRGLFYFPSAEPAKFVQCDASGGCTIMPCPAGLVWHATHKACVSPGQP